MWSSILQCHNHSKMKWPYTLSAASRMSIFNSWAGFLVASLTMSFLLSIFIDLLVFKTIKQTFFLLYFSVHAAPGFEPSNVRSRGTCSTKCAPCYILAMPMAIDLNPQTWDNEVIGQPTVLLSSSMQHETFFYYYITIPEEVGFNHSNLGSWVNWSAKYADATTQAIVSLHLC